MKELRTLKKWVSDYEQVHLQLDDLEVLFDFFKEGEVEENEVNDAYQNLLELLEDIEFRNMLSDEGDALSAVLKLLLVLEVLKVVIGQKCSCACI